MTEWVRLGDTGIEVSAERLADPDQAEIIAQVLDYRADCTREGTQMNADHIIRILGGDVANRKEP